MAEKKLLFVVQKHAASHLHYDFRLEIESVLASWAIPKGPSANPRIKRLAVATEDHPLDYARFEGVIPQGNYGAGTVMVWDIGTYTNIKMHNNKLVPIKDCLRNGQIEISLNGTKMHGNYALIKINKPAPGDWILIKMRDEHANQKDITKAYPDSALTGRSMSAIAQDKKIKSKKVSNK